MKDKNTKFCLDNKIVKKGKELDEHVDCYQFYLLNE